MIGEAFAAESRASCGAAAAKIEAAIAATSAAPAMPEIAVRLVVITVDMMCVFLSVNVRAKCVW